MSNRSNLPRNAKIRTRTYLGPDRRGDNSLPSGEPALDDRGQPIWKLRDVPARRKDDDAQDGFWSLLQVDSLAVEDDEPNAETGSYNPYAKCS